MYSCLNGTKLFKLAMKATAIQMLLTAWLATVAFANPGFSQEMLNQKITVHLENKKIGQVLKTLGRLSGASFMYSPELIQSDRHVSISAQGQSLNQVLHQLLDPLNIAFEAYENQILLKRGRSFSDSPDASLAVPDAAAVQAAENRIVGKVKDENGEPLPGVSVIIKGTQKGVSTDINGAFELVVPSENSILTFSFVGFLTQETTVGNRSSIDITLQTDQKTLEELVVVGYGTQKKTSVTAAISKVENKKLDQMPAGRPEAALVGRMAGVNISQTRSTPGSAPKITVRGPGSISASNEPLIVIDGFPGGSFNNINMNDVESIEVLKDASSAAIYGSRGSGGVIIITTKSGSQGKPKLNVNTYVGISQPMLHGRDKWIPGGQEFYDYTARYINRDFYWSGGDPTLPLWDDERRPAAYRVNPVIKQGNHNWEEILIKPAAIQNYSLSVSGKKNDASYYISANIKDEKGTMITSRFKQYSMRANIGLDISPRIKAGLMISPNYSVQRSYGGSLQNLIKMPPFLSPDKQENGKYLTPRDYWGMTVSGGVNPLATMLGTHNFVHSFNNVGEVYTKFTLVDGLDFKTSFGFNIDYRTTDNYSEPMTGPANLASGGARDDRTFNWINENVLNYNKQFGKHYLNALVGASYQYNLSRISALAIQAGSFANPTIWTLNNAIISPTGSYTSKSQWGLASYFGRVNYNFDEKYLLSASLRSDGSSRFGPDARWGYFPSGSVAWRVSQEPFFKSIRGIDELKLRASYGVVGNFNIGDFAYLGTIGDAVYAPGGQLIQGKAPSSFGNSKLQWEKTASYDFGVEVGFLDNRVNLVLDYYNKTTNNLLYNVSIPAISGFTNTIVNVGDIVNKGIELELNTRNFINDFKWQTSFNFTWNKNAVKNLGGGAKQVINSHSRGMSWILKEGVPMFSYYAYKQAGVLQTKQDMVDYPLMTNQRIGTVRYQDTNNDGKITADDRVILGSFMPKIIMGMVNDFAYRNFDLTIAMQSSLGAKMWNLENLYYQGPTVSAFYKPAIDGQWWSEEEPGDGKHPATSLASLEFVSNSDYYLENASFVAVRNINLGYTFPSNLTQRAKIDNLRLYFSVSNPWIFTSKDFKGYNPEGYTSAGLNGINSQPGHNDGSEPINRVFALGLNLNF
ncbi:TonB-dependent receptor [Ravibacter arvi]|uniref:TonB-dependent receptor n=1 Tax=Ravibacter arvi TaxID=2051041 RepID=A0ABP8M5S6_9BACT